MVKNYSFSIFMILILFISIFALSSNPSEEKFAKWASDRVKEDAALAEIASEQWTVQTLKRDFGIFSIHRTAESEREQSPEIVALGIFNRFIVLSD